VNWEHLLTPIARVFFDFGNVTTEWLENIDNLGTNVTKVMMPSTKILKRYFETREMVDFERVVPSFFMQLLISLLIILFTILNPLLYLISILMQIGMIVLIAGLKTIGIIAITLWNYTVPSLGNFIYRGVFGFTDFKDARVLEIPPLVIG
jgi:hypothetical protein